MGSQIALLWPAIIRSTIFFSMGLANQRAMGTDLLAAECRSAVAEVNLGETPPDERPSPAARNARRLFLAVGRGGVRAVGGYNVQQHDSRSLCLGS